MQVVEALLEGGAQVDLADGEQRTALRAASWGGHEEVVARLLERGADVNRADREGRTALIAAAYMGHAEIVEHLLDGGAEANHADSDGRTALSVAALCVPRGPSEGHAGVVALLLERGAHVDHVDNEGMTPLLVAAFEGHREVCELLLDGAFWSFALCLWRALAVIPFNAQSKYPLTFSIGGACWVHILRCFPAIRQHPLPAMGRHSSL